LNAVVGDPNREGAPQQQGQGQMTAQLQRQTSRQTLLPEGAGNTPATDETNSHLDPEWLREVTSVFGPRDTERLIMDQQQPRQQGAPTSTQPSPPSEDYTTYNQQLQVLERQRERRNRRQTHYNTITHAPQTIDMETDTASIRAADTERLIMDQQQPRQQGAPTTSTQHSQPLPDFILQLQGMDQQQPQQQGARTTSIQPHSQSLPDQLQMAILERRNKERLGYRPGN